MSKSKINSAAAFGISGTFLLIVAAFLGISGYPNQLVFYLLGLLVFILGFIPVKTINEFKSMSGTLKRFMIIVSAILGAALLIAGPVFIMDAGFTTGIVFAVFLVIYWFHAFFIKERKRLSQDLILMGGLALSMLNMPIEGQAPHKTYDPAIENPTYPLQSGPTVFLDEAHHNFHKLDGLYWGFGAVLRADGYITKPFNERFNSSTLAGKEIIVIANALNAKNETKWINPTFSAFAEDEQIAIEEWVKTGGSLFLIADHMPTSGAAAELADKFGIEFINGFAMDTLDKDDWFVRTNETLKTNIITNGFKEGEAVDSIITFTGQAFQIPEQANPILVFGRSYLQWEPDTAWNFKHTEPYPIEGYAQGIYMPYGKGKVVAFGEAMMFTSQLGWGLSWMKLGLSDPKARNNQQLLLNIIHWLDDRYQKNQ